MSEPVTPYNKENIVNECIEIVSGLRMVNLGIDGLIRKFKVADMPVNRGVAIEIHKVLEELKEITKLLGEGLWRARNENYKHVSCGGAAPVGVTWED